MEQLNYYELLGVKEDASVDEIKTAYKNQMKKWHPDINKNENATTMSMALNEAKKVLLDESLRRKYDLTLKEQRQSKYDQVFRKTTPKEKPSPTRNTMTNEKNETYQSDTVYVSKWVYLKEWLQYGQANKLRKCLGTIGVLLESLLCKLIVFLLYVISYICVYSTIIIQYLFSVLGGMACILFIFLCVGVVTNGGSILNVTLIVVLSILGIAFLNFVPYLLLSPKVFDFLYNKFDIYLFKKCVGYPK